MLGDNCSQLHWLSLVLVLLVEMVAGAAGSADWMNWTQVQEWCCYAPGIRVEGKKQFPLNFLYMLKVRRVVRTVCGFTTFNPLASCPLILLYVNPNFCVMCDTKVTNSQYIHVHTYKQAYLTNCNMLVFQYLHSKQTIILTSI